MIACTLILWPCQKYEEIGDDRSYRILEHGALLMTSFCIYPDMMNICVCRPSHREVVQQSQMGYSLPKDDTQDVRGDSPLSKTHSMDSRDTFGASGFLDYRENVYELSQVRNMSSFG